MASRLASLLSFFLANLKLIQIVLSVPWFPQGTVPDGPGHLFVMFLVAFVQVVHYNRNSHPWTISLKKTFQGVLATYWYSAGIEDFSAADV